MDKIQDDACQVGYFLYPNELHDQDELNLFFQHCLPDCEETHYTARLSSAPFRRCDYKNLGMTPICQLGDPEYMSMSTGSINPPMWGGSVIDQYRKGYLDL